jgi:ADP-ribose pyrophosphatase YjhB (NUDIX family)
VEWDESTEQAALREAREETGLEVRSDGLLGVYSRADSGILFVAYFGQVVSGEARASEDAEVVGFFPPDRLPPQPATHRELLLDVWFLQVIEDLLGQGAKRL